MRVPWIADVLRGAGLTVVETPGWRGRGRDFDGDGLIVLCFEPQALGL